MPGGFPLRAMLPALLCVVVAGCGAPAHSEREITAADAGAGEAASDAAHEASASPTSSEVRDKVAAIFGGVVVAAARQPRYLVGDFNGDGSPDLAVVVRPAGGALDRINSPVASWILKDVRRPQPAPTSAGDTREPVRAEQADELLAVIHGYGGTGWRNHDARQTFLLRNAVEDPGRPWKLEPRPIDGLMPIPPSWRVSGDVILRTGEHARDCLYWTGATYLRREL